jgi:hypothetical protein
VSDVVGLGKTFMSALLAQQLNEPCLVIAPPHLLDEHNPGSWPNVFRDFGVRGFLCESLGKLESLLERDLQKFTTVFIDESHRFRTEDSTKRILVRQIPAKPPYCIHACLVEETVLNDRNSMNIINIRESPECVLGILNSRLISFWFIHKFGKMQRETFPQFKVNELADFPLPKNRKERSNEIAKLVDRILAAKQRDAEADTSALEREIDELVYALYGLTPEEKALVQSAGK